MVIFKEGDYYSSVFCNSALCDSVMFRLFFTDASEQNVYSKVYSTEVSKEIFGDHSMIQHRIYCPGLNSYMGAAGVYKVN